MLMQKRRRSKSLQLQIGSKVLQNEDSQLSLASGNEVKITDGTYGDEIVELTSSLPRNVYRFP
jgi:hypothetical protein